MPATIPSVAFVGGGPRTAGILERLAANRPELFARPLAIHVIEPHAPGSGRIWRYDQHPGLLLNSAAADITMFTDASVACEGPAADGPGLAAWAAGVLDGTIADVPRLPPELRRQLRALTGATFPTRQLQSVYLEWFFRRAVSGLGPDVRVTVHRDTAVRIDSDDDAPGRLPTAGTASGWPAAARLMPTSWFPPWATPIRCRTRRPPAGPPLPPGTAGSMRHPATPPTSTIQGSPPART